MYLLPMLPLTSGFTAGVWRQPEKGMKTMLFFTLGILFLMVTAAMAVESSAKSAKFPSRNFNDYLIRNPRSMEAVRNDYRTKNGNSKEAVDRLLLEADDAISHGFYSVMNKKLTPKSGNKHDYMSIGIYWWPDQTKPDGLPYIRKDGKVNPEANNSSFDKQSLTKMGTAVSLASLAYYITGDKKYADFAVKQLNIWFVHPDTRMNPNLNFGQAVPGISDGRKDGIIEGLGFVHVSESVKILYAEKALPESDYKSIVKWYSQFLDWMTESPIGKAEGAAKNNHGTWYAVQIVNYSLFTGRTDIAKKMLSDYIKLRIAYQIDADGRMEEELQRTRPYHYSLYALNAFALLAKMGESLEIDLWNYQTADGRGIRRAFDFAASRITSPEKFTPAKSASSEEVMKESIADEMHFVTILRHASDMYKDPSYKNAAGRLLEKIYTDEKDKVMNYTIESDRSRILYPETGTPQ